MNGLDGDMNGERRGSAVSDGSDGEGVGTRGRLIDESLACRYLAAQCLVSDLLDCNLGGSRSY